MSIVAALIMSTGGPRIQLSNASDTQSASLPGSASVSYTLNANGNVSTGGDGVIGQWIVPQVGMGSYEARATLNSGSVTSGTTGSYLALSSTRAWSILRSSVGTTSAGLTIEIRLIGSATVLATATVTLSANVDL